MIALNPDSKIIQVYKRKLLDQLSLTVNDIYCLYKSNSGLIWVGTNGGGVTKISPQTKKFKLYRQNLSSKNILNGNMISGINEDNDHNLWISSWDNGISIVNRKENKVRVLKATDNNKGLNSDNIFMTTMSTDGLVLIATEHGGLNIYDPKSGLFKYLKHDPQNKNSIAGDDVMSVFEDHQGYIWLGHYENGLDRWDRKRNIFTHYVHDEKNPNSLAGDRIYTIYEDDRHNLWFAAERGGLSKYNPKTGLFKNYRHIENDNNSLSNDDVISIYQDSNGTLWFGTYGGGINKFDYHTEKFVSYKENDGLPNNVVYGILEDDDENLWLSTNKGLSRFNPKTNSFRNYDVLDGLQSNEFNSAFFKTAEGEMFFGGINGLTSFFPEEIKDNKFIPPLRITKFQIHNKAIAVAQKIDEKIILKKSISYVNALNINYEHNVISFEFAALNYFHSPKNQYTYKMEGFDLEWSPRGKRRIITYSNLPPGEYTFKVKGSNNDGIWNLKETSLKLIVEPAYWQTWWFIALIVIISAVLLVAVHLYKLYGTKEKNKQLSLINRKLKDEVKERVRAQREVVSSEKRFKQLARATFEAIIISEEDKILDVNQSAIDLLGYNREEFIGMPSGNIATPEYQELIKEKMFSHDSNPYKAKCVKKDGAIISVEIRGKEIVYDNKALCVSAITDISEKIHIETQKENLEEQLRQAQKMEAIGNLAGGVAHDFNNLLTIISGFAELGSARLAQNHKAKRDFDQIISASDKASQLTRQLLAFSRKQAYKPKVLDINEIILNLDKMISRLIPVDISIHKSLQEDLPMIFADPGQIEQILINLIVNSRDAIDAKIENGLEKRISISTTKVVFDRKYTTSHIESIEGMHICMEIKDTGAGMSKEVRQKIFEPFFTTKAEGKGTGLGLATVYGIVKQNDASITVESKMGKGTSIKVYWPSTEEVAADIDIGKTDVKHLKGTETILLVEDDGGVRNFASSSLKSYGYKVYSASNGNEALRLIEKDKLSFNMLVSDMVMPGMNGRELSEELLKRNRDLKYLIISGYSHDYISQDGVLEEGINFLQKPFSVSSLIERVRDILDEN